MIEIIHDSRSDYVIELLHQLLCHDVEEGLQTWSAVFDQWREAWRVSDCQRLLREIKRTALPSELEPVALLLARSSEGMLAVQLGNLDKAIVRYQQAIAIAQRMQNPAGEVGLLADLGNLYCLTNKFAQAEECLKQALMIYKELKHSAGQARTLANLGNVYRDNGRFPHQVRR